MSAESIFPETITVRFPEGAKAAVDSVARRRHQTPSEVMRQWILRSLVDEGVEVKPREETAA